MIESIWALTISNKYMFGAVKAQLKKKQIIKFFFFWLLEQVHISRIASLVERSKFSAKSKKNQSERKSFEEIAITGKFTHSNFSNPIRFSI